MIWTTTDDQNRHGNLPPEVDRFGDRFWDPILGPFFGPKTGAARCADFGIKVRPVCGATAAPNPAPQVAKFLRAFAEIPKNNANHDSAIR